MMVFLILAPYAAFTLLMLVSSPVPSLFAAAAICLMVIGHDVLGGRSVKLLGAGSAILFASLGGYLTLINPALGIPAVKLTVDCGMLAIALLSLAIRRPFTLQYALEVVDAQTAGLPGFLAVNYIITAVWTLAFLLMLMANILMIYLPGMPLWSGIGDRIRRPQHRALFHHLVSALPPRKNLSLRRRAVRLLKSVPKIQRSKNPTKPRRQDDERRVRQARHRFLLHHRVHRRVHDHR